MLRLADPQKMNTPVTVRVLSPLYVRGELFNSGDTTSMSRVDAEVLRHSGRVEFVDFGSTP